MKIQFKKWGYFDTWIKEIVTHGNDQLFKIKYC